MGIAADFVLIVIPGLIGGLVARALRLPLLVGYVAAGVVVSVVSWDVDVKGQDRARWFSVYRFIAVFA